MPRPRPAYAPGLAPASNRVAPNEPLTRGHDDAPSARICVPFDPKIRCGDRKGVRGETTPFRPQKSRAGPAGGPDPAGGRQVGLVKTKAEVLLDPAFVQFTGEP
jgi:hypothetical protein